MLRKKSNDEQYKINKRFKKVQDFGWKFVIKRREQNFNKTQHQQNCVMCFKVKPFLKSELQSCLKNMTYCRDQSENIIDSTDGSSTEKRIIETTALWKLNNTADSCCLNWNEMRWGAKTRQQKLVVWGKNPQAHYTALPRQMEYKWDYNSLFTVLKLR